MIAGVGHVERREFGSFTKSTTLPLTALSMRLPTVPPSIKGEAEPDGGMSLTEVEEVDDDHNRPDDAREEQQRRRAREHSEAAPLFVTCTRWTSQSPGHASPRSIQERTIHFVSWSNETMAATKPDGHGHIPANRAAGTCRRWGGCRDLGHVSMIRHRQARSVNRR